jgi:hypothetical protein
MCPAIFCMAASPITSTPSVRIVPGSTPFTVMFLGVSSSAAVRMSPFTPPLEAA